MTREEMDEMIDGLVSRPKFAKIAHAIARGDLAEAILRLALIVQDEYME